MSSSIQTTSAVGDVPSSLPVIQTTTNLGDASSKQSIPTDTTYGSMVAGGSPSELSHASGNILSLTGPVVAGGTGYNQVDQAMSNTVFGDFLYRNVQIAKVTALNDRMSIPLNIRPFAAWAAVPTVADKLRNFNYIRGSLIVTGKFMAPPLSSGMAVVSFTPGYEETSITVPAAYAIMGLHAVVDFSTSSDFEITLPWVCSSNWGNLHDDLFDRYWHMQVTVFSGLKSTIPDGCTSGCLQIFARPGPDFQLSGAQFQSGSSAMVVAKPSSSSSAPPKRTDPLEQLRKRVNDHAYSTVGMKYSQAAHYASGIAGVASALPVIGPAMAMVSGAAGTAATWLDWMGFTRDTVVVTPDESLLRTSQNLMNCDGADVSHVAALFSTNALSVDPAINGTLSAVDETSLQWTNSRYTYLGTRTFTVGHPDFQDVVFPVTPCMFNPADTDGYYPTSAGYTAGRFMFWRGDVKYIFYPVLSPVQRGALQFIWQPVPQDGGLPADLTNISLNTIVDCGAAQPIEITVGYNNDNPACYTDFNQLSTGFSPADYSTVNGYLRIRSILPFTGQICGEEVEVHIFCAAGENMEFMCPTESVSIEGDVRFWGSNITITPSFQSATIGAEGQTMIAVDLVPSSGPYPIEKNLAGERVESIRALIQKPSVRYGPVYAPIGETRVNHSPYDPDGGPNNYLYYFGTQYLAFAGGVRWKAIIDPASLIQPGEATPYELIPAFTPSFSGKGSLPIGEFNAVSTPISLSVETTVPYYWNELYVPAYKATPVKDLICWDTEEQVEFRAAYYRSAAPDARLTYFRAPNRWVYSGTGPQTRIHSKTYINVNPPGAREMSQTSDSREAPQITLEQYRARTGREAFKVNRLAEPVDDPLVLLQDPATS